MIDAIDELVARSKPHHELARFHRFHRDHATPYYARAITILHPEFNGRAEFRGSAPDEVFGRELEPIPKKRPKNYARRLRWADGTPLERGWRPTLTHHVGVVGINKRSDIHPRIEA